MWGKLRCTLQTWCRFALCSCCGMCRRCVEWPACCRCPSWAANPQALSLSPPFLFKDALRCRFHGAWAKPLSLGLAPVIAQWMLGRGLTTFQLVKTKLPQPRQVFHSAPVLSLALSSITQVTCFRQIFFFSLPLSTHALVETPNRVVKLWYFLQDLFAHL